MSREYLTSKGVLLSRQIVRFVEITLFDVAMFPCIQTIKYYTGTYY
jgi:hypothetical protein